MEEEKQQIFYRQDFRYWLNSLQEYIKQTNVTQLDLSYQSFENERLKSILNILADSQISELALKGSDKENINFGVLQSLSRTKVQKLRIDKNPVSEETLMAFMSILNDTQITQLEIPFNSETSPNLNFNEFISCVQRSKLVSLHLGEFQVTFEIMKILPQLITRLPLFAEYGYDDYRLPTNFFSNVGALTSLTIGEIDLLEDEIGVLVQTLANSKLEELCFVRSDIGGSGVKILAKGLVHSNVSVFSLQGCSVSESCLTDLTSCFQSTHLKELDLSYNSSMEPEQMLSFSKNIKDSSLETLNVRYYGGLDDKAGQVLVKNLAFSKVSTLDVSENNLGLPTILALEQVVSTTNLVNLILSNNELPDEALVVLQSCVKKSPLKNLNLCGNLLKDADVINTFLENVSSNLQSVNFGGNPVQLFPGKVPCLGVTNSCLTHLDLSWVEIVGAMKDFAANLKLSAITHLNLSRTGIIDDSAEILANCLEGTQVVNLNLSHNSITGVKAIPRCVNRTKLIHLDLSSNKIENNELQEIAERVENTYVTTLNVMENPGKRHLLIESVLWRNKIRSHKLISFFKQIAPQTDRGRINFDRGLQYQNVSEFLDECLQFYKTVSEQPAAVVVLAEEATIPFSKSEIITICLDRFPNQLAEYAGTRIEVDVAGHVEFLKEVEDMGLAKIVVALLLNRPNYIIDEENGILHPYVYKLLLKYKLPICNVGVEPDGVAKITAFFNRNSELDGATEIVTLLRE